MTGASRPVSPPGGTSRRLPADWAKRRGIILRRDAFQCTSTADGVLCPETGNGPGGRLEVDHIVPRSRGGTDHVDNLRTLCAWHHKQKTNFERTSNRTSFRSRLAEPERHPGMLNL